MAGGARGAGRGSPGRVRDRAALARRSPRLAGDLDGDAVGEDVIDGGAPPPLLDDLAQLLGGGIPPHLVRETNASVTVPHLARDSEDPAQVDVALHRRLDLV